MSTAKLYKTYNRIIKTIIVVAAVFFLYNQLFLKNTVSELIDSLGMLISRDRFLKFLIPVVLLMPVNWMLEALKWKIVVSAREKISLAVATKAVFAGATISSISVNRTGEFLGRVFVLKKHSFWEGTVITIVGSYAQTFNTFLWGTLSAFFLLLPYAPKLNAVNISLLYSLFLIMALILAAALFFYYKISWINKLINPKWKKIAKAVSILRLVDNKTLNIVMILSAVRFLVFSSQFYILMRGASIDIDYTTGLMLISVMFLFNTIRPSIALIEIGLRSASALIIFEFYFETYLGMDYYPQIEIVAVTSFIWLINIVLPAIFGLFFIKDLRFFKKENTI
jgi:hypothetical protein